LAVTDFWNTMLGSTVQNRIKVLQQQIDPYTDDLSDNILETAYTSGKQYNRKTMSVFGEVEVAPRDPILGLTAAFKEDKSPNKVNLGVGAYRTAEGKPFVLPVVKRVEQMMLEKNLDKEYIPQSGLPEFQAVSPALLLGKDSPALREKRVRFIYHY
jgi:hypothetical protein